MSPRGYSFSVGGRDYRLHYDINTLCDLEGVTGKSIIEIFELLANPTKWSLSFARDALFVGIEPKMSRQDAAALMVELGGMPKTFELVANALEAAFPDAETDEKKVEDGRTRSTRPRKAGTGSRS